MSRNCKNEIDDGLEEMEAKSDQMILKIERDWVEVRPASDTMNGNPLVISIAVLYVDL